MPEVIDDLPQGVQEKIRQDILEGRKLDAVKTFREATGQNLLKCKTVIEDEWERLSSAHQQRLEQPENPADSDELNQILDLIFTHNKLDAVKVYKDSTGVSLLAAKKFIEDLTDQLKEDCPDQFKISTGNQLGCAGALLVFIAVVLYMGIANSS